MKINKMQKKVGILMSKKLIRMENISKFCQKYKDAINHCLTPDTTQDEKDFMRICNMELAKSIILDNGEDRATEIANIILSVTKPSIEYKERQQVMDEYEMQKNLLQYSCSLSYSLRAMKNSPTE